MKRNTVDGLVLRMYLGEDDRLGHQPLYEALVIKARQLGLAGATVLRGPMGFGAHHEMHTEKILRLSTDLPVLLEVVDEVDKIRAALPEMEKLAPACLVTLQSIEMRRPSTG